MSNFSDNTFHPVTGKIEMAHWIDNHFGRHHYAVKFPNDDTTTIHLQINVRE